MKPACLILCKRSLHVVCVLGAFLLPLITHLEAATTPFEMTLRHRVKSSDSATDYLVKETKQQWKPRETAVIVCDMWDLHHCKNAVTRVGEMSPRMNDVLVKARKGGALIIHAPSSCTDFYEGHPGRLKAKNAHTASNLPEDIGAWCYIIPEEEQGVYPIDQSDGGEDDDLIEHEAWAKYLESIGRNPGSPWIRQVDTLQIDESDAITDDGKEIWNLLEQRRIKNVILLGVHTNMCVLGRPFGLRQMAKNGKNVVLMRDMTDTMYNPKMWPYVDHFRGTELIVEHIEKFVCPTVTSDQILGGETFHFKGDPRAGK
jgi:nicotinamidase-related amidase